MQPRPRGRDLLRQAVDAYRAKPNPSDAEKVVRGTERMLDLLEHTEKDLATEKLRTAELAETVEAMQADVEHSANMLVFAAWEQHQLHHTDGWAVCPSPVCRAAAPLYTPELVSELDRIYRPIVVRG